MDYSSEGFELVAVLLVTHGSSGSHLLFKYPFLTEFQTTQRFNQRKTLSQILNHKLESHLFKLFYLVKNKKSPYSMVSNNTGNWITQK